MKRMMVVLLAFACIGVIYASTPTLGGRYTETLPQAVPAGSVPVSDGYEWTISTATNGPVGIMPLSQTVTQIGALTAQTTGQFLYCSNCTRSYLCVSSGTVNPGAWVVAVETGTMAGNPTACK